MYLLLYTIYNEIQTQIADGKCRITDYSKNLEKNAYLLWKYVY